jgi:hypothetical protein
MTVKRLAISMDPELADEIRARADAEGISVSAWLADAARREIRHRGLGELLAREEAERGPVTTQERQDVERLWLASR